MVRVRSGEVWILDYVSGVSGSLESDGLGHKMSHAQHELSLTAQRHAADPTEASRRRNLMKEVATSGARTQAGGAGAEFSC